MKTIEPINCSGVRGARRQAIEEHKSMTASVALRDIAAERRRQIEKKGYTSEHDDSHNMGELGNAAAVYAMTPVRRTWLLDPRAWVQIKELIWPWWSTGFKSKDRRHDLVVAGALIVAEIERMDRLPEEAYRP